MNNFKLTIKLSDIEYPEALELIELAGKLGMKESKYMKNQLALWLVWDNPIKLIDLFLDKVQQGGYIA